MGGDKEHARHSQRQRDDFRRFRLLPLSNADHRHYHYRRKVLQHRRRARIRPLYGEEICILAEHYAQQPIYQQGRYVLRLTEDVKYLAKKCANMRIFADDEGKLNLSVSAISGEVLVVSNFTLYADASHGNRPSFTEAAHPEVAEPLYEEFCRELESYGLTVKTGVFGADMALFSVNDGPVTIVIESRK